MEFVCCGGSGKREGVVGGGEVWVCGEEGAGEGGGVGAEEGAAGEEFGVDLELGLMIRWGMDGILGG